MFITETKSYFKIDFKFNPKLVAAIKEIPDRRFDPNSKSWLVPLSQRDFISAFSRKYGFKMDSDINQSEVIGEVPDMPSLAVEIPLKMKLFNYQATGVAYALEKKRLIIGDQPGLGKTAQAIATIVAGNAFPCLVIAPSSLKINWQREWHMWSDKRAMILNDSVKNNFHLYYTSGICDVFIVNYESLKKYFVQSISVPEGAHLRLNHIRFKTHLTNLFKSIIIDESHRVKSTAAQQSKFTKGIAEDKEFILALSGTPVINKPKDLISQLGIINQMQAFGGYKKFTERYCAGPKEASNLRELNYLLKLNCFYRRDKHDVLKELPAKMRQVAMCQINTRKEYKDAEDNLIKYLRQYKDADDERVSRALRGEIMVKIGLLKNISARGKLNDVFDFVDDILASGEKLVIFAHLREIILAISKHYPNSVMITGEVNQMDRQNNVDSFQNNPKTRLIICSIKAAGVGITLTAASRVAFVELPWTAADCDQCEDRCHRIGQHDSVTCTYFLGENTIDEEIYKIIQHKRNVAASVTGSTEDIEENIIDMIATLFTQKPNLI